ncbi:MAG: hypothetical protein ACT4NY_23615 [Pseudonocardiales bacterium]
MGVVAEQGCPEEGLAEAGGLGRLVAHATQPSNHEITQTDALREELVDKLIAQHAELMRSAKFDRAGR